MMMRGSGGAFSVDYVTSSSATTDGVTQTHSGVSIGAADSDRVVIVAGYARCGSGILGCTIGSITATLVSIESSGHWQFVAYATVPAGTTADIVISGVDTTTISRSALAVYRSVGAIASDSDMATGNGATVTVDSPPGGFTVATSGAHAAFTDASCSWSGVSEDVELYVENFAQFSAGHTDTAGIVAATPTWSTGNPVLVVAASFGP